MIEIKSSLSSLLGEQCPFSTPLCDRIFNHICFDSRKVGKNDLMLVLPSVSGNEERYIEQALNSGASLVVGAQEYHHDHYIQHKDAMALAALVLNQVYKDPTNLLDVIGVTGTNGKSSVTFYVAQLLDALGKPSAVMGTLGYGHWDNLKETGMTTLPLPDLYQSMAELAAQYQAVAMEVSSHGLDQNRLSGIKFHGAVFTNLSRDHLDYHGDMDHYFAAKQKLFMWPELHFVVINGDDDYGQQLLQTAAKNNVLGLSYGRHPDNDLMFEIKSVLSNGAEVEFRYHGKSCATTVELYGEFNIYNCAAAVAVALASNYDFESVVNATASIKPVKGRMELVSTGRSDEPTVLVDYAHTPDAVTQLLKAAKQHCKGKLITVVGCGGDRDRGKRPLMAQAAVDSSDHVIFTNDNPRTESPQQIVSDMVKGLKAQYQIELDRKHAIELAVQMASPSDVIVIAGKGHEEYQDIQNVKHSFSDQVTAYQALLSREQL
ncbi:UDP-N-acetylmuramoyl-L-alanyl-D-glutamate--2,6-diaminopimelate ligase [Bermanella sp. R86510]|uniref:UDP-N-acetylmuramoyl-L-alanyl-D-glutamate--2, 6-diaminopimelate ligase n=1 Tax=unclassified Bermanella TaxID=2627862 RepID=UPI0037C5A78E